MSDIESNKKIKASSFIDESAGVADAGKGVKLSADGKLHRSITHLPRTEKKYFTVESRGDRFSRWNVTNPTGTTFRYTWSGSGGNPNMDSATFPIGCRVTFSSSGFAIDNRGNFAVTGSGTDFVEVDNPSGVEESSKRASVSLQINTVWTKPANLTSVFVQVQGGGASGECSTSLSSSADSGNGGGYTEKTWQASELASDYDVVVGGYADEGVDLTNHQLGVNGFDTLFHTLAGLGGLYNSSTEVGGSGGDININGGLGFSTGSSSFGGGGSSFLGASSVGQGRNGALFGSGGAGTRGSSQGGWGGAGVVIITEYYN